MRYRPAAATALARARATAGRAFGGAISVFTHLRRLLIGERRDLRDPQLFHKVSLVAFMAWVGLGADGLSSSAYGPEEAFNGLRGHPELTIFLALATALTVLVISSAYSRIIEHFPAGGGGYVVATKLLGAPLGVVSGCALLVDYVLTISVSIASGADQIFSFLPLHLHPLKLPFQALMILGLVLVNLRGVRESVALLVPVFLFFIFSHVVLLGAAFVTHAGDVAGVAERIGTGIQNDFSTIGLGGILVILARAYAHGAGTFTGIETVSNGVQIMREPKVATAKRTMVYMALSLAITAGGLLLAYMLVNVTPERGKTLNAVLAAQVGFGPWFVIVICVAEACLLVIAAQSGFLGGPRVMAYMALDSWLPHRFSSLCERLTSHYGIILIGGAAVATLLGTGGNTRQLVLMYSINVFVTFSLTELGMCRFWFQKRRTDPAWKRQIWIFAVGLVLCASILALQIYEKWSEGGWETAAITSALILFCFGIQAYYRRIQRRLALLSPERLTASIPEREPAGLPHELDRGKRTAVLLVGGYNGLGVHSILTLWRFFPGDFKQILFVSVGVLDSGNFKGTEEVERLHEQTRAALASYCALARRMGMASGSRIAVGYDPVEECEALCLGIVKEFPRAVFFAGKLVFRREGWFHWMLHNQTAQALQRRLEWNGTPMIVLPIRVGDAATVAGGAGVGAG